MQQVTNRSITQSEIVKLRLLRTREARLRYELRQAQRDRRKVEADIRDAIILGADVEDGEHTVHLETLFRLQVF